MEFIEAAFALRQYNAPATINPTAATAPTTAQAHFRERRLTETDLVP